MITDSEISTIGSIIKPHGINGEVSAIIDADIDLSELRCVVIKIEGINVPFFVNTSRARGSEAMLITFDGIKNEQDAAEICGHELYALTNELKKNRNAVDDEGFYVSDLIGFTLADKNNHTIGIITGYEDSTANVLLIVETANGKTKYIPIADEFVEDFDANRKLIALDLPEGILEI